MGRAPPRTVHIVEHLDRGAVEAWLVRMLSYARVQGVALDWTFYCALGQEGRLDAEVRALGGRIVHSPAKLGDKLAFCRALRAELQRGAYEVLHAHHDLVSAVYLVAALGLPLRTRIVHVHNADENVPTPSAFKRQLLREPMRRTCLSLADRVVGISQHTLDTFLGGRKRRPGRDLVHHYGVDATPFERARGDRLELRRALELSDDALIFLFPARIVREKNPVFAVDVLAALRRLDPRVIGVFAGAGAEEGGVRQRAREQGIAPWVRMLGWRDDLPEVMCASDLFVLPHLEEAIEGFGLAILEAQLAGLPLLLSIGVADDPLLPSARYRRLPLAAGPPAWARAALELLRGGRVSAVAARQGLKRSPMAMDRSLAALRRLHA